MDTQYALHYAQSSIHRTKKGPIYSCLNVGHRGHVGPLLLIQHTVMGDVGTMARKKISRARRAQGHVKKILGHEGTRARKNFLGHVGHEGT